MKPKNFSLKEKRMQIDWIVDVLKKASSDERGLTPQNEKCLRKSLENIEDWPVIDITEVRITAFDLGKLWPESQFIQKGRVLNFQREFDPRKQCVIIYKNILYHENIRLILGYFPEK